LSLPVVIAPAVTAAAVIARGSDEAILSSGMNRLAASLMLLAMTTKGSSVARHNENRCNRSCLPGLPAACRLLAAPHASQHGCPQIAVDPRLISGAFGFVEGEHIGVDAQASELLDRAIEAARTASDQSVTSGASGSLVLISSSGSAAAACSCARRSADRT
jgi:hypothetical protein